MTSEQLSEAYRQLDTHSGNLRRPLFLALAEIEKLRALENALRKVSIFGHTDDCNSYMGWGNNDACDCPTKDVKSALKALDEGRDA